MDGNQTHNVKKASIPFTGFIASSHNSVRATLNIDTLEILGGPAYDGPCDLIPTRYGIDEVNINFRSGRPNPDLTFAKIQNSTVTENGATPNPLIPIIDGQDRGGNANYDFQNPPPAAPMRLLIVII